MKFSLETQHPYSIQSYASGQIVAGGETISHAVIMSPQQPPQAWPPQTTTDWTDAHFEQLLAFKPEIVVLGTGAKLRFPPADITRCLVEHQIGLEVMDTASACRTYNVLLGEDRRVVAALMMI